RAPGTCGPRRTTAASIHRAAVPRGRRADSPAAPRSRAEAPASPSGPRGPGLLKPVEHEVARAFERDPLLGERVAVADRDRPVVEGLVVDRERPRRADLVLAAVALADRRRVVVLRRNDAAQLLVQRPRLLDEPRVLADQRQDGDLHWREPRMQTQHRPLLAVDLLLVVG